MSVLVTQPSWALSSIAAVRQYLRADTATEDDTLALLLRSASARIERHTRRKLKSRRYQSGDTDNRFVLSGRGENRIMLPQYPVTAIHNAWYAETGPNALILTQMNSAAAYIEPGGVIVFPNDTFPLGVSNIRVDATCGYASGVHDAELYELEHACLRLCQSLWQDYKNQTGRTSSVNEGGASITLGDGDMPADVVDILVGFMRTDA